MDYGARFARSRPAACATTDGISSERKLLMPSWLLTALIIALLLVGVVVFRRRAFGKVDSNLRSCSPPQLDVESNNIWYRHEGSDTVIVYVHGILSDSKACWQSAANNGEPGIYWPELLVRDQRAKKPDIFLGGYYTAIDAADYDLNACAKELRGGLGRVDPDTGFAGPLAYPNIIFVCHSTGGIVVRYLLVKHAFLFSGKRVGLLLIASPSKGSHLADVLAELAAVYGNKLGEQLQWNNDSLVELDRDFKDLVHNPERPFDLFGREAYENHFIFHMKGVPDKLRVVTEESAGKYFDAPRLLRKTNHFSSVKPDKMRHPAHELLIDYLAEFHERKSRLAPDTAQGQVNSSDKQAPSSTGASRMTDGRPGIRFVTVFEVDDVSLVGVRSRFDGDNGSSATIEWPAEIHALIKRLEGIIAEAELPAGSSALFSSWLRKDVAEWLEWAHLSLKSSKQMQANAHIGLDSILKGTKQYYGIVPDRALKNFALMAAFDAGFAVAYKLGQVESMDSELLVRWLPYIRLNGHGEHLGKLLNCREPIWSTSMRTVSNLQLNLPYFYGPKSMLIEFYRAHGRGKIISGWFDAWVIPQMEIYRVRGEDTREVIYDETAKSTLKFLDENSKELTHI